MANNVNKNNGDGMDGVISKTGSLSLNATANGQAGGSLAAGGLNPQAKEFVPRFGPAPSAPAPANDYQVSNKYNNGWNSTGNTLMPYEDDDIEPDDYALTELKEAVDYISVTPGAYDMYIGHITEVLNSCIEAEDDIVLDCAVNTVVDQAIIDPNFRYNGVRMCVHFVNFLLVRTKKGTFKDILQQRCHREIARRESLIRATDGGTYLRGLTLFVGDLATSFPAKEILEGTPVLISTLLNKPNGENVKTVCMALKLCGATIDKYCKENGSNCVELIFKRMKELSESHTNTNVCRQLISVIEQREKNWTFTGPTSSYKSSYNAPQHHQRHPPLPQGYNDGPGDVKVPGGAFLDIWYPPGMGPNGPIDQAGTDTATGTSSASTGTGATGNSQPSTSGGGAAPQNNTNSPPSYDFGPCGDEQDDDVCDAFEEFLRASGQMR